MCEMAKYLKLLPLLIALALLAGMPAAVSGQVETTISFSPTSYTVAEDAGTVTVTMTISNPVSYDVSVDLSTSDGTARAAWRDYTAVSETVTFPENTSAAQTVEITITDDLRPELDEYFTVSLESSDERVAVGGTATVTIVSDDALVLVFDRDPYSVQETSSHLTVFIRVVSPQISCPYDMSFSVRVFTSDGSAISSQDFQHIDTIVNFEPCRVSEGRRIYLVNDNTLEPVETFLITMERTVSTPDFVTFSPAKATVSIYDDSDRVYVALEGESYSATETDGHIEIGTEITHPGRDCTSSEAFSFRLTGADPEGTSREFGSFDPVVTFDPCDTRRVVRIPIVDDNILELTKTFHFRLERTEILDRRIRLSSRSIRVTLTDSADDTALLGFDRAEYTVTEGASLDLGLILSGDPTCPVEFQFDVLLGSAIPQGARSAIAKPASRVAFESCDLRRDLPIDTSDIEATAELRFELGRTSDLDSRISIGQATAAAYVVDSGGTTQAFETLATAGNNNPVGIWSDGRPCGWRTRLTTRYTPTTWRVRRGTKGRTSTL